ncbi:hypothetical protein AURDEDRAFT_165134 [Auricularia subglabra TFB-10046 SS5]|nr:hypothetical protein AURDEDRAFT_165134 [Auricularia subglabra TFB-10046 SS5]
MDTHDNPHKPLAADDPDESVDDPFQAFISAARSESSMLGSPSPAGAHSHRYQPSQWQQLPETPAADPFADEFEVGSEDAPVDVIRELQRDALRSSRSYEALTIIICEGTEDDDPLDLVDLVFEKDSTPDHKHAPSDPFVASDASKPDGAFIRPLPAVEVKGDDSSECSVSVSNTFEHIQRRAH